MLSMKSDEPVHAVIAVDAARDRVLVVTVYPPDSRKWSDD
jgi:hypothetical protein